MYSIHRQLPYVKIQKFVKSLQLQKEETPIITIYYQSTVKITNGRRTLFKGNAPVKSVPLSECLANIVNFLSGVGPSSTTCHTVLIGHNPSVFDTPMLLQCAGLDFKQMLSLMNVSFAVSLHLVKTLTKSGHKSLNPGEKRPKAIFHLFISHCFTKIFKHTML